VNAWINRRLGPPGTPRAPEGRSSTLLAEDRTLLATGRTLMAADRSLMAWIRTSLSMLSFGFTIYKLLQGFQESGELKREQSPRTIGLFMTALGTFAMVAGVMEYWNTLKQLPPVPPHPPLAALLRVRAGDDGLGPVPVLQHHPQGVLSGVDTSGALATGAAALLFALTFLVGGRLHPLARSSGTGAS